MCSFANFIHVEFLSNLVIATICCNFYCRDDPELDTMLKERVRWGDPMAHLVKASFLNLSAFIIA